MTQPDPQFRVVMRGYDPAEVDRALAGLRQRVEDAESLAAEARSRAEEDPQPEEPTYEKLGERVGQILALADAEAKEMRDVALAEAEDNRKAADQAAISIRDEADQYSEQKRRDADTEAAKVLADAKRNAEEVLDAAQRDAATKRQEGEAFFEQQRANAAKAAADFERTLAERRERSTAEFQEQQAATQAQLDAMIQRMEETRAEAQREQEAAEAQARRIVMDAEERATALVEEARSNADRIRTDSERELAAATQRRDSINAQLANVRQMLATLTGSSVGFAVDPLPDDQAPASATAAAEPAAEPETSDEGDKSSSDEEAK